MAAGRITQSPRAVTLPRSKRIVPSGRPRRMTVPGAAGAIDPAAAERGIEAAHRSSPSRARDAPGRAAGKPGATNASPAMDHTARCAALRGARRRTPHGPAIDLPGLPRDGGDPTFDRLDQPFRSLRTRGQPDDGRAYGSPFHDGLSLEPRSGRRLFNRCRPLSPRRPAVPSSPAERGRRRPHALPERRREMRLAGSSMAGPLLLCTRPRGVRGEV